MKTLVCRRHISFRDLIDFFLLGLVPLAIEALGLDGYETFVDGDKPADRNFRSDRRCCLPFKGLCKLSLDAGGGVPPETRDSTGGRFDLAQTG